MIRQICRGEHIAILDNPADGRPLPTLAVAEEFVRLGYRVTYVTTASIASALTLLGPAVDSWCAVGFLDDSTDPAATLRGYFHEDMPDLMVYRTNTSVLAARLLATWPVPAAQRSVGDSAGPALNVEKALAHHVCHFLSLHGLALVPHGDLDSWVRQ